MRKPDKNDHIVIIGGDKRQLYLYNRLLMEGFSVVAYDVPEVPVQQDISKSISYEQFAKLLNTCDIFILPIPFSRDGGNTINSKSAVIMTDTLLSHMCSGTRLIGGCLNEAFLKKCNERKIITSDLMDNPSFELQNTIATAEGAIAEAITRSPMNLHRSRCLVTGYGKCSKAICGRLGGLHANVTVCARKKEQQISAFEQGFSFIDFGRLPAVAHQYDFIFNTVPSLVLTGEILQKLKKDTVIIDIASKPGGTDFEACSRFSVNASLCLSLPGKYSPKTSADIIYDCIMSEE